MAKSNSCFQKFFIITLATVLVPFIVLEFFKYKARSKYIAEFDRRDVFQYEHDATGGFKIEYCKYPYVMRNALNYGEFDDCKNVENLDLNGPCADLIKNRIIERFGDRIVSAYAPSHKTDTVYDFYADIAKTRKSMNVTDYFANPEYERYGLNFLQYLGTEEEYKEFLNLTMKHNITKDCVGNDMWCAIENNPHWDYVGSQFFITHFLNSGSFLHFAFAMNIFTQLAGRKRWLLVNPAYTAQAGCFFSRDGILGTCTPNNYMPNVDNISIDAYRDILLNDLKIPEEALFDIILEPGDILLNCQLWGHAVQNLDRNAIAFAIRATLAKKPFWDVFYTESFLAGLMTSVKTKLIYNDWEKITLLDFLWNAMRGNYEKTEEETDSTNAKVKKERLRRNEYDESEETKAFEFVQRL